MSSIFVRVKKCANFYLMPQTSSKMVVFSAQKLMILGVFQIILVCRQMVHTLNNEGGEKSPQHV